MQNKLIALRDKITEEIQQRLKDQNLACQVNLDNAVAEIKEGKKYTKINAGSSGKYMIDNTTQEVFGIKAYGVVNKGHRYGTLDTINNYYWGNYKAQRKVD